MSTQRVYTYTQVFGVPITGLKNLWEPATEFQGKKQDKPTYMTSVIVPKTRAQWFEEPAFAGMAAACQELYTKAMSHIPFGSVQWPIKDGDVPEPGKKPVDWMKGCWFLPGSSTSAINIEMVMPDGSTAKVFQSAQHALAAGAPATSPNKSMVKPGDIVTVAGALAVKTNNPLAVKFYANNVLFMGPGEEIAIGNGVSGTQLMEQARAMGLNITGFQAGGGSFGGGQIGAGGFAPPAQTGAPAGFQPQQAAPSAAGFGGPANAPVAGFAPPASGGFTPPATMAPAPVMPAQGGFAPPAGAGFGQAPQQQPGGFQPPAGFGAPR